MRTFERCVMPLPNPKFRAWLQADQAAQAVERQLHEQLIRSGFCGDPNALKSQAQTTKALREQANALFDEAMREMKDLAEALHHRRVLNRRQRL